MRPAAGSTWVGTPCIFSPDRFFNVMGEGWYVETRHGPVGPFTYREQAERYLATLRERSRRHREEPWDGCRGEPLHRVHVPERRNRGPRT
ncbi:MAG: hypothetical protein P8180_04515 [Gammaproteobacteria bacterium]